MTHMMNTREAIAAQKSHFYSQAEIISEEDKNTISENEIAEGEGEEGLA